MNIVLASDNNFVQHCCVTMTSILRHNKDVVFYLFTEGLSEENVNLLTQQVECLSGVLNICIIDSSIVSRFPMPKTQSSHISVATYYRLFAEFVLPQSVDRLIYLDCDIVVRGDLTELYNTNLDGYAIAAVFQHNEWGVANKTFERMEIPVEYGYFNAGVLLINLCYWRNHDVSNRLLNYIRDNYSKIRAHDQDTLNAILYKEVKPLDYIWNYLPIFLDTSYVTFPLKVDYSEKKEPVVIHYVNRPKPWEYYSDHPYTSEYYYYLDFTPFKGWRPKWNWASFKKYRIKPFVRKIKNKFF